MSSIGGPGDSFGSGGIGGDGLFSGGSTPSGNFSTNHKKGESLKQWMESYLGPEGWKKFQSNLCSMIDAEIKRDQQQAHEASEKLKKSEEGEPT